MTITCDYCGKTFERKQSKINDNKRNKCKGLFCNRSCANYWRNKRTPQEDALTPFRWFLRLSKIRMNPSFKSGRFIESTLTVEDVKHQWEIQSGICPYTGWKLNLPKNARGYCGLRSIKNASIDRIDSTKDYNPDNIQFVAIIANYAKNIFSENELLEFCNAVTKNCAR